MPGRRTLGGSRLFRVRKRKREEGRRERDNFKVRFEDARQKKCSKVDDPLWEKGDSEERTGKIVNWVTGEKKTDRVEGAILHMSRETENMKKNRLVSKKILEFKNGSRISSWAKITRTGEIFAPICLEIVWGC